MLFYFANTSTGTGRSVIPRSKENQDAQLSLNFFYAATYSSPKKTRIIFLFGLNQNNSTCKRVLF